MKDLLRRLIEVISYKSDLDGKKRYVAWYHGFPLILTQSQLTSAINTSYLCTQDHRYFNLPEELHTIQMRRAKQKLNALQSINSDEVVEKND